TGRLPGLKVHSTSGGRARSGTVTHSFAARVCTNGTRPTHVQAHVGKTSLKEEEKVKVVREGAGGATEIATALAYAERVGPHGGHPHHSKRSHTLGSHVIAPYSLTRHFGLRA